MPDPTLPPDRDEETEPVLVQPPSEAVRRAPVVVDRRAVPACPEQAEVGYFRTGRYVCDAREVD